MSSLAGTVGLVRHALRTDRLLVGAWLVVLLATCFASATATADLYPSAQQRLAAAEAINASPAVVALYGPILDVHSLGELAMTKMTVLYAVFVAGLSLVMVLRHTRVAEEIGQTELVAGTAVGRDAPLAAAVLGAVVVAVLLGALAAGVDVAAGLPVAGSVAFGASWAGIGSVAAALTAVACQLSASARTCASYAAVGIGAAYGLRAAGDAAGSGLSWLSPFGWSTRLRAWGETRWWVLLLYVALTGVLAGLAQVLRAHRDLGSGLLAARPGPSEASPRLSSALALSVRVHRSMVVTWTVAMALVGLVLGAVAPQIGDLLDSPSARDLMQRLGGVGGLVDGLVAAELSVLAVVVTCFAIAVVGHGGADERDGRADEVLATATSRTASFMAVLAIAMGGATWLLLVTGVGVDLGYAAAGGPAASGAAGGLRAALAQVPAVWLTAALAAGCLALRGRWTPVAWGLLVLFVTLGQIGALLRLPAGVVGLSPYSQVPAVPVEAFSWRPELEMTAAAVAVTLVAWWRYRSRDVA